MVQKHSIEEQVFLGAILATEMCLGPIGTSSERSLQGLANGADHDSRDITPAEMIAQEVLPIAGD